MKLGNKIIEITKGKNDKDYRYIWQKWKNGDKTPLSTEIKNKLNLETKTANINFLGVWDTVPGSSLKEFGVCKEKQDRKDGDRYKSDSYPTIKHIAHAVSIDEKRTKFSPLLICPPIQLNETKISEVWFPGAHADVGGGYKDENGLAGISLQWMLERLNLTYSFENSLDSININPKGLSHWSIGDRPANIGSECLDRVIPPNAEIHQSYKDRKSAGMAPVRIKGKIEDKIYPLSCSDIALKKH